MKNNVEYYIGVSLLILAALMLVLTIIAREKSRECVAWQDGKVKELVSQNAQGMKTYKEVDGKICVKSEIR